ncbi:MAG: malto-oligosyltrehalose synthase [Bryobacterales bacterium]|nr:malto-oligosyltrehalose synthase [Bryobacterales bacterium]
METHTEPSPRCRVPTSTYRIQFSSSFRFRDAWELVPYLRELGITDLYASPRAKARKGSSHGYDVADAVKINSELGTEDEFEQLVQRLKQYQMEMLLDIVPNHMAASVENPYWADVLENGRASVYADFFDIDWHPATSKAAFLQENRILLPILGDLYGSVLTRREIVLRYDENGFFARYYDHRLPLGPKSYLKILEPGREELLDSITSPEGKDLLRRAIAILAEMPVRDEEEPQRKIERQQEIAQAKSLLWELYLKEPEYKRTLDDLLWQLSGDPQDTRSFDALDDILSAQVYRIAYWRIAVEEINYRRFFDINDLVGVRVEAPEVFDISHREILKLMREGKVAGVRIDHIDGLRDPLGYLRRLQGSVLGDGVESGEQNFYILAEKILGCEEKLPEWPLAGTTGYDYLNALNGIFVNAAGLGEIVRQYDGLNGIRGPFSEICHAKNKLVMDTLFANEINVIGHYLGQLAAQDRRARDIPLSEIRRILVEATACLPVYRTYLRGFAVEQRDRDLIEATLSLARARTRRDAVSDAAFEFMGRVLLVEPPYYAREHRAQWLAVVMRWQQFSGPVMAKGLEDSAFYSYNALLSLNEVGGDPLRNKPPFNARDLHDFHAERQRRWPGTMNCTSTHDTKRSEDVRARLNVLTEMPREYQAAILRWIAANESKRTRLADHAAPTPSEEILIYQSLLGAWPLDEVELPDFQERFQVYVRKCAREAKEHTNWVQPNEAHESALAQFVDALFHPTRGKAFREDFLQLQPTLAFYGAINSLSQVLLKATAPGIPDFYQGMESWNFSLVDPDNRRPVDFRVPMRMLEGLRHAEAADAVALAGRLSSSWRDGRIKLFTTTKTLEFRRARANLFARGEYIPLHAHGPRADHIFAFARRWNGEWCIVVAPLHLRGILPEGESLASGGAWDGTAIVLPEEAPAAWKNQFTGESLDLAASSAGPASLPVSQILGTFPVGLLCCCEDAPE